MAVEYMVVVVEAMVEEAMVVDKGMLEEHMEVWPQWPQCSQVLPLILLTRATVTTSLMATRPILRCLHVLPLPNQRVQMVWTTDTPTVSSTGGLVLLSLLSLLSLSPMPTRQLP